MTEWITWTGGECPIPDAKAGEYELLMSNVNKLTDDKPDFDATEVFWHHNNADAGEVIAYRLIEKEQSDLDWLEPLVQVEFDHQNAKPPNYASIAAREAYRNVLDLIKQRKEAKS